MREDTRVTKVYRFEELSDTAQEKAMEKLYDINVDYSWWDCVYEDAKNIGIEIKEFDIGRGSYCKGTFTESELDVAENILKEHGKDCETYMDAYEFVRIIALAENAYRRDWPDEFDADGEFDVAYYCPDELEWFQQTIFENYRLILRKEYDYLTSEEAIRDMIEANDYEFTEDGRIY